MKLILGGAQFGLPYGVTRAVDHVTNTELDRILELAATRGISMLDLSPAYGNAEQRVGSSRWVSKFDIQTKTRGGTAALRGADARADFSASLAAASSARVVSLLIHDANSLLGPYGKEILSFVRRLQESPGDLRVGVSVYDRVQVEGVLAQWTPDIVQLPVSLADQRLVDDGTIANLASMGITVQARSIFLQGLLLMAGSSAREVIPGMNNVLRALPWSKAGVLEGARHCFGFVRHVAGIAETVVGVHSHQHLLGLLDAFGDPAIRSDWQDFAFPSDLVDPRAWT